MDDRSSFKYKSPSVFGRIAVAWKLLIGLRGQELQSVGSWIERNYAESGHFVGFLRFVGWAVKTMLVDIPNALVGVTFAKPISKVSYWLAADNPVKNHPWASEPNTRLPEECEVVVIGAGFTGAACAYHWSKRPGGQMVLLEMNEAASGASGRNEGVVVMGRFYSYVKKMLLDDLPRARPDLDAAQREHLAEKFAEAYVHAAYKNADMIEETIREERFEVDYSRVGWVQGQTEASQEYLDYSVRESYEKGFDDWDLVEPKQVLELTGMNVGVPYGLSRRAATWHPAKWVWSLVSTAIKSDNVDFFSRTRVHRVEDTGDRYAVHTNRGTINARYVINATESYTASLHPEFIGKLVPIQTNAAFAEGGPSAMKEHVAMGGPNSWFGKHPDGVILGTGGIHLDYTQAGRISPSRFLTDYIIVEIQHIFGHSPMHVFREWSCTAGFTDDEYPIVGLLDGKRQYIIAGMCGSGSGVHFNGARHVVDRILGIEGPDDYPDQFFSPKRVLDPQTHHWPE